EATHLAIADDVDAGALLVADRELRRVVERLFDVGLAIVAGLDPIERAPEPARKPVTTHDVGWNARQRCGHLSDPFFCLVSKQMLLDLADGRARERVPELDDLGHLEWRKPLTAPRDQVVGARRGALAHDHVRLDGLIAHGIR